MVNEPTPSAWARERFGPAASKLMLAIPAAIERAHERAVGSYDAGGHSTHDDYGTIWLKAHEELVRHVCDAILEAHVIRPGKSRKARYFLPVVNGVALYPWRYGRDRKPLEEARFPQPVSPIRLGLRSIIPAAFRRRDPRQLDAFAHTGADDQELEALLDEEEALKERQHDLPEDTVFVAYTSHPDRGVLNRYWADVRVVDEEGTVSWGNREPLPPPEPGYKLKSGGEPTGPAPTGTAAGSKSGRFDDSPLAPPDLSARPPLTGTEDEGGSTLPPAGSDDEPR